MTAATGPDLAHNLGGTWLADLAMIFLPGDRFISCRPTGKVYLNDRFQLGWLSDGVEHLTRQYALFAAALEVAS